MQKYADVNGIHVVQFWRVPDSRLTYTAYVSIKALTDVLPKKRVLESMTNRDTVSDGTLKDYPIFEHAFLASVTTLNWDVRVKGVEVVRYIPFLRLLGRKISWLTDDKYHAEDIHDP